MSLRQLEFYFHASLLACYLFLWVLLLFVFFFSISRGNFNMDRISYYITRLFVCTFVCSCRLYDHFCAGREEKASEVGLPCWHAAINSYGATTSEMVSRVIV